MIRAALPHGTLGEDRIVWSVVDEHLDEAEFLASLWASARRSGLYALAELERGPERRLLAHVDGLESNGPLALERVVWPVVDDAKAEPMRLCAAALTLLESGDFRVLDVLEGAPEPDATGPDATEPDADGDGDEDLAGEANAVDEGGLDFGALGPEALEQKRLTDLKELDEQLAATTDEAERGRLLELQAMLQADAPDPAGATEDAAGEQAEPRLLEPEPEVDPRLEPLGLALALASHPQLGDHIRSRAAKADGPTLALLLRACGDRGLHPGPALDRGLVHEEPAVVCAALRAATFGDRPRLLGAVEGCLQHRQAAVRGRIWSRSSARESALASSGLDSRQASPDMTPAPVLLDPGLHRCEPARPLAPSSRDREVGSRGSCGQLSPASIASSRPPRDPLRRPTLCSIAARALSTMRPCERAPGHFVSSPAVY